MHSKHLLASVAAVATMLAASPAIADDDDEVSLVSCDESLGTIALVDGDMTGWTEWDLGSPRELVNILAAESGCFTPHSPASGDAANFLVTVIAGSEEQVDQSISTATGVATQALVSSGAASAVARSVPFGGSALGLLGGLGGRKTTYAAGIRVVSPANGMTLASGRGMVTSNSISFGGRNNWAKNTADSVGYDSRHGRRLLEAFIVAFNNLVAQRAAIEAAPALAAPAPETPSAQVAIDTIMRAGPTADSDEVRGLRQGTELTPTGNREGLFIEVTDNFGTLGWVSVEDLL
jgi:hypothetical protein